MGKYSLLVFDWDGTLLDSKAQIVNCMQSAIKDLDLESRSNDEITNVIGLGLEKAVLQLYPMMDMALVTKAAQTYREHYLYKDKTPSPLFDGTEAVIKKLREAGYDLAIATNKSRRGLDKGLSETGLNDYFPITRTADDAHPKPHPQMLEEILTDHNTQASKALMIGDSEYDLQLANNSNVDGLAVSYGVHGLMHLLKQDPVGFIDKIGQLPDWLENHG